MVFGHGNVAPCLRGGLVVYFQCHDSPPSVNLTPERTVNRGAGKPKAASYFWFKRFSIEAYRSMWRLTTKRTGTGIFALGLSPLRVGCRRDVFEVTSDDSEKSQ